MAYAFEDLNAWKESVARMMNGLRSSLLKKLNDNAKP